MEACEVRDPRLARTGNRKKIHIVCDELLFGCMGGMQWVTNMGWKDAETRDRTRDLQIFALMLSQLSYRGSVAQLLATSSL